MQLGYNNLPQAGQAFHLSVIDYVGKVYLSWYIDKILVSKSECEDPPCYVLLLIPGYVQGSKLRIVARDDIEEAELELTIGGSSMSPPRSLPPVGSPSTEPDPGATM